MTHAGFRGRREDFRLVTGQGQYTADRSLPGQLYGHFLRADRAHAKVLGVDIADALAAPGVVAVLTGEDTREAGFGPTPLAANFPGKGGKHINIPHREVLAETRVRFVGQNVALVIAETPEQAQEAAEMIGVDYEDLAAVVHPVAALEADAPQLYDNLPGNLAWEYEYGDEAATEAIMASAAHVTRIELDVPHVVGVPMEPKAGLVAYDAATGVYDVYVPTQGMTLMRPSLAGGTGIPTEKIRVHAKDVGGGFGIRSEGYTEYCALMLAAQKTGRPVKWVGTRSETFVSDHHGRGVVLQGELALDKDGTFLAARYTWLCDMGAYLSNAGAMTSTVPPSTHAVNLYKIPTLYGLHRLAMTNTTPTAPYRGAARPNVTYLIERLVEEAAHEMGIDPIDLRRRNLIAKSEFPFKTPTGSVYDSGDPAGLLEDAIRHADVAGFEARRIKALGEGKLRGLGLGMMIEPSGGGMSPIEEAHISFGSSGELSIHAMCGPSGQGHETVFPEIVGRALGIDAERITLHASDPDGPVLRGDGTIGSRSLMSHGSAFFITAQEVIKKGRELAAEHLEVASEDVTFENGRYAVAGTDLGVTLTDLAQRYTGRLDTTSGGPGPRAFPTGAHVAEVEIDRETGALTIVNYVAVDDAGNLINPALAEGQVHGGIVQGLGQILYEAAAYDSESGQLITGSFMDYTMPRADCLPVLKLYDRPIPAPGNPLGAKGVGEAGTTGAVPTLANAIINALRPLGITRLDAPYTPAKLWHAIAQASP